MKAIGRLLAAFLFIGSLTAAPTAAQEAPDALVRRFTQEIRDLIRKDRPARGTNRTVVGAVAQKALPHLNILRMTSTAAGQYWLHTPREQQQELASEFAREFVYVYSHLFAQLRDDDSVEVRLLPGENPNTAVVRADVVGPSRGRVPVAYLLERTADGWKIYDVSVDNASQIQFYRNVFDNEISRGGVENLIRSMALSNHLHAQELDGAAGR